jgi:hypothetical protein
MSVPVKKTRKPAVSVRYLLSGDRKLQQLSLKKIADPAEKTKPRARSTRVKQAMDEEVASTSPKRIGGRLAVVGVVCLFAAAAVLAARQSAARPDVSAGAPPEVAASPQQPGLTGERDSNTTATAAMPGSSTSVVARPNTALLAIEKTPAPAPVKKTPAARAAASPTAAPEPTAAVKSSSTLTVEGCLESVGSTYSLKNTSGLDAPKVRSWRTGFLKKRSSAIGLVDTTGRLRLQDRIGTRVAATGSLVDRELRATALRQVAASCR